MRLLLQSKEQVHHHHQGQHGSSPKIRPIMVRGSGASHAGYTLHSCGGILVVRACKLMNPCRWQQEDAGTWLVVVNISARGHGDSPQGFSHDIEKLMFNIRKLIESYPSHSRTQKAQVLKLAKLWGESIGSTHASPTLRLLSEIPYPFAVWWTQAGAMNRKLQPVVVNILARWEDVTCKGLGYYGFKPCNWWSSGRSVRSDPFSVFYLNVLCDRVWCNAATWLVVIGEWIPWQASRNSVMTSRCWCSTSESWLKAILHTLNTWAAVPKIESEICWVIARAHMLKLAKLFGGWHWLHRCKSHSPFAVRYSISLRWLMNSSRFHEYETATCCGEYFGEVRGSDSLQAARLLWLQGIKLMVFRQRC